MDRTPPETNIDVLSLPWEPQTYIHPDQLTPDSLVRITDENGEEYVFRLMPVGQAYYVAPYEGGCQQYDENQYKEGGFVQYVKQRVDSFALQIAHPGKMPESIELLLRPQHQYVVDRIIPDRNNTLGKNYNVTFFGFPYAGFRKNSPLVLMRSSFECRVINKIASLEAVNILPESPLEQTLLRFMEEYLSDRVRQRLAEIYHIDDIGSHENIAPGLGQAISYDLETFDHRVAKIAYLLLSLSDSPAPILGISLDALEELCSSIGQYVALHTADSFSMAYGYKKEICLTDTHGDTRYYSLRFQITAEKRVLACFSLERRSA